MLSLVVVVVAVEVSSRSLFKSVSLAFSEFDCCTGLVELDKVEAEEGEANWT